MKNAHHKKRIYLSIIFGLGIVLISAIALSIILESEFKIQISISLLGSAIYLMLIFTSFPFLQKINFFIKLQKLIEIAAPVEKVSTSLEKIKSNLEELKFQQFQDFSEDNIDFFYRQKDSGNIFFPHATRTEVVLRVNETISDFTHPTIGMILTEFVTKVLKKPRLKDLVIIVLKPIDKITDSLITDSNKIMFFKQSFTTLTQLNVLVNFIDSEIYYLHNSTFFPSREYRQSVNLLTELLK